MISKTKVPILKGSTLVDSPWNSNHLINGIVSIPLLYMQVVSICILLLTKCSCLDSPQPIASKCHVLPLVQHPSDFSAQQFHDAHCMMFSSPLS